MSVVDDVLRRLQAGCYRSNPLGFSRRFAGTYAALFPGSVIAVPWAHVNFRPFSQSTVALPVGQVLARPVGVVAEVVAQVVDEVGDLGR